MKFMDKSYMAFYESVVICNNIKSKSNQIIDYNNKFKHFFAKIISLVKQINFVMD